MGFSTKSYESLGSKVKRPLITRDTLHTAKDLLFTLGFW